MYLKAVHLESPSEQCDPVMKVLWEMCFSNATQNMDAFR